MDCKLVARLRDAITSELTGRFGEQQSTGDATMRATGTAACPLLARKLTV